MPSLERLIAERYPVGEWAVVYELAQGTGFRGQAGRIDAAAFGCWPSKGFVRIAMEVKRTRGDFMRELDKPAKRRFAEEHFHQTYFVVPHGLVKPEEVPESWGLLAATKNGAKLRRVKVAMDREVKAMPESLALSAIRALAQRESTRDRQLVEVEGDKLSPEELSALVHERAELLVPGLERNRDSVRDELRQLEADRRRLKEPLEVLAAHVLERSWAASQEVAKEGLTAEHVRRWIDALAVTQRKTLLQPMRTAHDALARLLEDS